MLRAEDNKFLTESGSGTPIGEICSASSFTILLSKELPEADGTPKKIVVMGEELLAFRRSARGGRCHRSILPAPRRQSLAWAQ